MEVKILPEKPLSPLNELFPKGVPVDGELEVNGSLAYIFNTEGVSRDVLKRIAQLATSDNMPFAISAILLSQCELVIPKEWVCGA
ncbi:hypothetical protein NDI39_10045 [Microcoleus sp. ZQ-A2]|nr:hypothetical protein [Microcoleus sp. FACHB-1]